ncbi:MAG: TolC family protein [Pseudomonadota bacterium]
MAKKYIRTMAKIATSSVLCTVLVGMPLLAQAEIQKLTLIDALKMTLENNESIQESHEQIKASEGQLTSSKGQYDLTAFASHQYGAFNSLSASDYTSENNAAESYSATEVGLRQRIPTGSMLSVYYTNQQSNNLGLAGGAAYTGYDFVTFELTQSLLKGIGDKEQQGLIEKAALSVKDSKEARRLKLTTVLSDVVREYWLLALAKRYLETSKEVLAMAEEVLRREKVRYGQGLSLGVDVDRAQTASEQRRLSVIEHERDIRIIEERLLLLLHAHDDFGHAEIVPVTAPKDIVAELPSLDASLNEAQASRSELKQMAFLLAQLGIDYNIAENNILPSLDLTLQYRTHNAVDFMQSAEDFNDTDAQGSWYGGITFSMPLQNREALGAKEYTSRMIRVAKNRLSLTQRTINTEVREAVIQLKVSKSAIPIAKRAMDASLVTMKGEMARFKEFQANNRDLLASQDALAANQMLYFKSIIDYNLTLLSYRVACGTFLENYQVIIDEDSARIL